MTKEEGVRIYYQAVRDYAAAKSEKQRYQKLVDEQSASRSSYIRQRDTKDVDIRKTKDIIANLKSGKTVVQQLIGEQQQHNRSKGAIAEGLSAGVRADDVVKPDVEGALDVVESSSDLQIYDQNIREEESNLTEFERERRILAANIENCDRQIRSYSGCVDNATRNMRTQQNRQNEYRKYLYM